MVWCGEADIQVDTENGEMEERYRRHKGMTSHPSVATTLNFLWYQAAQYNCPSIAGTPPLGKQFGSICRSLQEAVPIAEKAFCMKMPITVSLEG